MSSKTIFPFHNNGTINYPTEVVIKRFTENNEAKIDFQRLIRRYWSLIEQAENLRKLFLNEVLLFLTENKSRYPVVVEAILVDWANHAATYAIEWEEIYTSLVTNTPLPSTCNDVSRVIYHTSVKREHGWKALTNGATSNEEGGKMFCAGALTICLMWLKHPEYRRGFNFTDATAQIIYHSYAYAVQWEKVVQSISDNA